jgi:hypothetical protein
VLPPQEKYATSVLPDIEVRWGLFQPNRLWKSAKLCG